MLVLGLIGILVEHVAMSRFFRGEFGSLQVLDGCVATASVITAVRRGWFSRSEVTAYGEQLEVVLKRALLSLRWLSKFMISIVGALQIVSTI